MAFSAMFELRRAATFSGLVACAYIVAWYWVTFFVFLSIHLDGFGHGPDQLDQGTRGAIALVRVKAFSYFTSKTSYVNLLDRVDHLRHVSVHPRAHGGRRTRHGAEQD